MVRDMDLCREIMRQIGANPELNEPAEVAVEGRSDDEITYQLHILRQAGLIEAIDYSKIGRIAYKPLRLTWDGNEFLAATRDDKIWNRAKAGFGKAGGALTYDLLLAACKAQISNMTGLDF